MKYLLTFFLSGMAAFGFAFSGGEYWQQQADYTITAELNSEEHILTGTEKIEYYNNSNDTLKRLFFHTYWNSIKPNGNAAKWIKATGDFLTDKKFLQLQPGQEGSQLIMNITVNGAPAELKAYESITEVVLSAPLLPHSKTTITLSFEAKVPIAVRRAGRDNTAGTDYSMCQWYPRICRYDTYGWHADPYIGREFAGTFGNYDVTILLDKKYTVAGTGDLLNKTYLEKGYTDPDPQPEATGRNNKQVKKSWHFTASNVHDFAWAADDDFYHVVKTSDGIDFHFFYHNTGNYPKAWQHVADNISKAYAIAKENFGPYPYRQFSFIQAGEGYMEYPMCTFLEEGDSEEFMSTAFHEFMHAWFYGIFGSDENMFHWMDEGLTSYAESRLYRLGSDAEGNINSEAVQGYLLYRSYATEESASVFANYFKTSEAYVLAAYYKGQLFAEQLRYIIGEENVKRGFLKYYDTWKFRHPQPDDFVGIMENVSGIELSWYQNYWLNTTKTINYSVEAAFQTSTKTQIILRRKGDVPMPVDVEVQFSDGSKKLYYIPLDLMYGKKPHEKDVYPYEREDREPWSFAVTRYELVLENTGNVVPVNVKIDPLSYMADIDVLDNEKQVNAR